MKSPSEPVALQALFRAEIDTADGRTAIRLVLRRESAERFDLAAADAFGQALWGLAVDGDRALWTDPRRSRFCRWDASAPLPVPGFSPPLPVAEIAAILLGEAPSDDDFAQPPPEEGRSELRDRSGRRWSGQRADGRWLSWSLWRDDQPLLWWRRDGGEQWLSAREPAFLLRWRESARGSLSPGRGVALTPPTGFVEEGCGDAAPG